MTSPTPSWKQVRELFRLALELPLEDREAFLAGIPQAGGLRREVRSLLEAHDRSEGFLEPSEETELLDEAPEGRRSPPPLPGASSPPIPGAGRSGAGAADPGAPSPGARNPGASGAGGREAGARDEAVSPAGALAARASGAVAPEGGDPLEGRLLGAYRLVHRLESGGMGTVYLAVRADEEYQQRVAVKILRQGRVSGDLIARFRNERQILAALDHPWVAKLLDGGTTREGLPYLVMEYIEGEPIDRHCNRCRLTVHQRIELFRKVCSAVQFAHQNLVIHRDLKPNNILITPSGAPKLLDFGIAKLLNPELSAASPVATSKFRLLTPEYASPEQILGRPVSTAADVYSLGVLLYLLLTGSSPYGAPAASPVALAHWIAAVEVPRPSERVLRADGRGAEKIPATKTRPTRRPPREEIHRRRLHLRLRGDLDAIVLKAVAKEPRDRYASVEALSDDLQRTFEHRPVLARPRTPTYRFGRFLRRNRLAATVVTAFVVAVLTFLLTLLAQQAELTREKRKAELVSELLTEIFQNPDPLRPAANPLQAHQLMEVGEERIRTGLAGEPEVRSDLQLTIGRTYQSLGFPLRALASLEASLETRRQLFGEKSLEAAEVLTALGSALAEGGGRDLERAERYLKEALEIRTTHLGNGGPEVAETLGELAILQQYLGELDLAESMSRRTLAMYAASEKSGGEEQAIAQDNLGVLLMAKGEPAEAETLFRSALGAHRERLGAHPRVAYTLNNLGGLLHSQKRSEEAIPLLLEALEIRSKALGDHHPNLAISKHNLAAALAATGDSEGAEKLYHEAIALWQRQPEVPSDLANGLYQLALLLFHQERFAEVEAPATRALEILESLEPRDPRRIGLTKSLLGGALIRLSRYPEAETYLLEALEILGSLPERKSAKTLDTTRKRLEILYEAWDRPGRPSSSSAEKS